MGQQRATPRSVVEARAAIKVALPIRHLILHWQTQAAWLAALGHKARSEGNRDIGRLEEAVSLLAEISAAQRQLRNQIADIPRSVASNSHLEDTLRALDSAGRAAAGAVVLLRGGTAERGIRPRRSVWN